MVTNPLHKLKVYDTYVCIADLTGAIKDSVLCHRIIFLVYFRFVFVIKVRGFVCFWVITRKIVRHLKVMQSSCLHKVTPFDVSYFFQWTFI